MNDECKTCGAGADGYKCAVCGEAADEHDPEHACGAEHCQPKCEGCNQAEVNCTC